MTPSPCSSIGPSANRLGPGLAYVRERERERGGRERGKKGRGGGGRTTSSLHLSPFQGPQAERVAFARVVRHSAYTSSLASAALSLSTGTAKPFCTRKRTRTRVKQCGTPLISKRVLNRSHSRDEPSPSSFLSTPLPPSHIHPQMS